MSDDRRESALGRWSRLKRTRAAMDAKAGRGAAAPTLPEAGDRTEPKDPVPASDGENPAGVEQPQQHEDLPDIGSLTKDSDFTVFMRAGVPEDLRRQALRALWRSDPVLANLDGLNDFDEDYRTADGIVEVVRTAYRVGKGYLEETDETAAVERSQAAPEPAQPDAPAPSDAEGQPDAQEAGKTAAEDSPAAGDGDRQRAPSNT